MRQDFVFTGEGGRGHLGHHEPGVQSGVHSEKRRKTFIQRRIYQALDASLGNPRQRA